MHLYNIKEVAEARELIPHQNPSATSYDRVSQQDENVQQNLTVQEDNQGNFFWDAQVKESPQKTAPATNQGGLGTSSDFSEDTISVSQ